MRRCTTKEDTIMTKSVLMGMAVWVAPYAPETPMRMRTSHMCR
jgi:hypothetical protein